MAAAFTRRVTRETDVVWLRQMVLTQAERIARLEEENAALQAAIDALKAQLGTLDPTTQAAEAQRLQERIDQLEKWLWGRRTERTRTGVRGGGGTSSKDKSPKAKGHGPTAQPALETEIQYHEAAPEERICPTCGRLMEPLPGQYEESEEITVIPRRFLKVVHRRQVYLCPRNDGAVTAPGPRRLLPGGRYSLAFTVQVVIDKFAYHLPYERQTQAMKAAGLRVTPQTLWDQGQALADLVAPTLDAILAQILSQKLIHADETRWPLLANGQAKENQTAYAWCVLGDGLVAFRILKGRGQDAGVQLLKDFKGVVMADGYEVYAALARAPDADFVVAHCWAHVRRKFVELQHHDPATCGKAIAQIDALFALERQWQRLTPDERWRHRQTEARPIVDDFFRWVGLMAEQALPRASLQEAFGYVKNLKAGLRRFLDDPRIPLSNNAAERAQRGLVLGRKNFYGSRSEKGTKVAAIFYSLIESAKLAGVDPAAYLLALATNALQNPGAVLLPADFRAQQPSP